MEREEWTRLAQDMRMLVRLFDFELPQDTWSDVDVYTRAIDCFDRVIDGIDDDNTRKHAGSLLIECLLIDDTLFSSSAVSKKVEQEMNEKLSALRRILRRREVTVAFCEKMKEALSCSEALRDVDTLRRYVFLSNKEGALASELLVILLGNEAPPSFQNFLVAVGGPANVLDNFRDARRDFQEGVLPLRPGVRLHLRLAASFMRHGLRALRRTPAPLRLARWGLSELVRPIAAQD